jgi:hypothetical protein
VSVLQAAFLVASALAVATLMTLALARLLARSLGLW